MDKKTNLKTIDKLYLKALRELEKYVQYCLRCLHRIGIHPQPADFIWLVVARENGTMAEAVLYPKLDSDDYENTEPMFFLGYKMDFDFKNLEHPIVVEYCDNIRELRK